MIDRSESDGSPDAVGWRRMAATAVTDPVVRQLPYLELKLQHRGIDPMAYGEVFFPDAVPYELDGDRRVFYWRAVLPESALDPASWSGSCATPDSLIGVGEPTPQTVDLVDRRSDATEVTVDATIAGESTLALLDSYRAPEVVLRDMDADRVVLSVAGQEYTVPDGTRRQIRLPEQDAVLATEEREPVSVTPELVVRFPGERRLFHPAPGADYRLFPSFDLDLERLPTSIDVPTAGGEVDHEAMAATLDVDLSTRPYPERVLWQAFVVTTFGRDGGSVPRLAQFDSGLIALVGRQR